MRKPLTVFFSFCKVPGDVGVANDFILLQPAITCSKLTIDTLEQGVKYVQS